MKITAILLLLMILLTSCTAGNGQSASTSGGDVTTSGSEEIPSAGQTEETTGNETYHPILKKTSVSKDDLVLEMTYEEYRTLVGESQDVSYGSFHFLLDENGDMLVLRFAGDPWVIDDIHSYPKRTAMPSDADFEQISEGMSVYDVVALVGLPIGTYGSGLVRSAYRSVEGNDYSIFWMEEWNDLKVSDMWMDTQAD